MHEKSAENVVYYTELIGFALWLQLKKLWSKMSVILVVNALERSNKVPLKHLQFWCFFFTRSTATKVSMQFSVWSYIVIRRPNIWLVFWESWNILHYLRTVQVCECKNNEEKNHLKLNKIDKVNISQLIFLFNQ